MTRFSSFKRYIFPLVVATFTACGSGEAPAPGPAEPKTARELLARGMDTLGTDQSKKDLFAALRQFRSSKDAAGEAETLFQMGRAHQEANLPRAAATAYAAARRAYDKPAGTFDPKAVSLLEAELYLDGEQFDKALPVFEELYLQAMNAGDTDAQWRALRGLAEARGQLNQVELANQAYQTATRLAVRAPAPERAALLESFAAFEAKQGYVASAREHLSQALALLGESSQDKQDAAGHSPHKGQSSLGSLMLHWVQLELAQENYAAARLAASVGLASNDAKQQPALQELLSQAVEWLERQAATHRLAQPAPPELAEALRRIDPDTVAVRRSAVLAVLQSPQLVTQTARLAPAPPQGKTIPFEVYGVSEKTLWGLVGFQNGDRILSVNGYDWNDLNRLSPEEWGLPNATRLVIDLTRQGVDQQIVIAVEPDDSTPSAPAQPSAQTPPE